MLPVQNIKDPVLSHTYVVAACKGYNFLCLQLNGKLICTCVHACVNLNTGAGKSSSTSHGSRCELMASVLFTMQAFKISLHSPLYLLLMYYLSLTLMIDYKMTARA